MDEGSSIGEFLDQFNSIVLDLSNIGIKIEDEDLAIILLSSLPSSYSHFVDTLRYSKDKLVLEEVLASLKSKSFYDEKVVSRTSNEVMYVNKGREGDQAKGKRVVECWHCHKLGHLRKDCPERKKKAKNEAKTQGEANDQNKTQGEANNVIFGKEYCHELLVAEESAPLLQDLPWILDSGCTHHMSPSLDHFSEIVLGDFGLVKLGSKTLCQVKGVGSIKLWLDNGTIIKLNGVRFVPELRHSFVSLGKLDGEGCEVRIKAGCLQVFKGGFELLNGKKKEGLYVLNGGALNDPVQTSSCTEADDMPTELCPETDQGPVLNEACGLEDVYYGSVEGLNVKPCDNSCESSKVEISDGEECSRLECDLNLAAAAFKVECLGDLSVPNEVLGECLKCGIEADFGRGDDLGHGEAMSGLLRDLEEWEEELRLWVF